jgi:hypothetical protein
VVYNLKRKKEKEDQNHKIMLKYLSKASKHPNKMMIQD